VDTVNCALGCGLTEPACVEPCTADAVSPVLEISLALIACLGDNGCHLVPDQAAFDQCLIANCAAESDACLAP
jgi:hypothetical protein